MKNITIAGNVGKDAEVRTTGDSLVTSWTVAVEDRTGKEKGTLWFDCSLWGKRGAALAQYITKGSKLVVSGELSAREHNSKTYLSVRAEQVTLMGGKPQSESFKATIQGGGYPGPQDQVPMPGGMDDEIPFAPEWRV